MNNVAFKSIPDFLKAFPDKQTYIDHLTELRWYGNVESPLIQSQRSMLEKETNTDVRILVSASM